VHHTAARKRLAGCPYADAELVSHGDGKAMMGLRNRRGRDQPFYCLGCHPELGGGLPILDRIDS
jgi:hypothetical protein